MNVFAIARTSVPQEMPPIGVHKYSVFNHAYVTNDSSGPTLQAITEDLNKAANRHRSERDSMHKSADVWAKKRDLARAQIREKRAEADAVKKQRDAYKTNYGNGKYDYSAGGQAAKEKLDQIYGEMEKLNKIADEAHEKFVLCKEAADREHQELTAILQKMKNTRDNLSD